MTQSPTQIDIEKLKELLTTFRSEPPSLEFASYAYNKWRAEIEGAGNALLESVPSLILMAERVERLEAAYRDLQRYIYDRTPERREQSIERHVMKLAARNALSPKPEDATP